MQLGSELQELEPVKAEIRGEENHEHRGLREQQFRLAAYTKVVMRLLCDEVPKTIRLQLLRQVWSCMSFQTAAANALAVCTCSVSGTGTIVLSNHFSS